MADRDLAAICLGLAATLKADPADDDEHWTSAEASRLLGVAPLASGDDDRIPRSCGALDLDV